jgi:anaerobic ribonucleoside-triphosphate reductase activating protein
VQPDELVGELLADPAVDGLTLSGGEPMLQAAGLAEVVRLARTVRPVSVITFTGYRLERLRRDADPGVARLLAEVDVLIDGRYVQALDDGVGLRGSSNQRVHHLTGRLRDHDLAAAPRVAEIRINDTSAHLVGVPPRGLLAALDDATARLRATGHVRGRPMHAGGEE